MGGWMDGWMNDSIGLLRLEEQSLPDAELKV
jgi:hypothetical protein